MLLDSAMQWLAKLPHRRRRFCLNPHHPAAIAASARAVTNLVEFLESPAVVQRSTGTKTARSIFFQNRLSAAKPPLCFFASTVAAVVVQAGAQPTLQKSSDVAPDAHCVLMLRDLYPAMAHAPNAMHH